MSSLEPAISIPARRRKNSPLEKIGNALDAKVKVELPGRHVLRVVAIFVGEREANLDDLQQIYIAAHRLIVVVR